MVWCRWWVVYKAWSIDFFFIAWVATLAAVCLAFSRRKNDWLVILASRAASVFFNCGLPRPPWIAIFFMATTYLRPTARMDYYELYNAAYLHSIKHRKFQHHQCEKSHSRWERGNYAVALAARSREKASRCTNRLDGAGNWFLETNEFREWKSNEAEADKAILFCYWNPGVGKTDLR